MQIRWTDKAYVSGFQYITFAVNMMLNPAVQNKNYLSKFMSMRQTPGIRQRMVVNIAAARNKNGVGGIIPGNGMIGNIRPYLTVYESISFKFLMIFIFHKY